MAIPNFAIVEFVRSQPFRDRAMREAWDVRAGHLAVPVRPGLGVELEEEALAASPPHPVGVPRGAWATDGSADTLKQGLAPRVLPAGRGRRHRSGVPAPL
jgi:hypothetical protein